MRSADDFRSYGYSKSLQGKLHFPCAGSASYPFVDLPPMNECRAIIHRQQVFILPNPNDLDQRKEVMPMPCPHFDSKRFITNRIV